MKTLIRRCLPSLLVIGALGTGCCPELRQVLQDEAVEAMPGEGDTREYSFVTEDCFDDQKEVLLAVLWKGGKQEATAAINELDIAEFPAQTCGLLDQAVEALGNAIGGALDDAIGDIGCLLHLVQGPEFSHDDQVLIQDLRDQDFEWKLFKLGKGMVFTGRNSFTFTVADSAEQCDGTDERQPTEFGYALISEVDNVCDEKFKR